MILSGINFQKQPVKQNSFKNNQSPLMNMNKLDSVSFKGLNSRDKEDLKRFLKTGEPTLIGSHAVEEGFDMKYIWLEGTESLARIWWDKNSPKEAPEFFIECAGQNSIRLNGTEIKLVHPMMKAQAKPIKLNTGDEIDLQGVKFNFEPPEKIVQTEGVKNILGDLF